LIIRNRRPSAAMLWFRGKLPPCSSRRCVLRAPRLPRQVTPTLYARRSVACC